MAFKTDNQTITDLRIIDDVGSNDIYGLFNRTKTKGGARTLKEMFLYPLSRANVIEERASSIQHFRDSQISFSIRGGLVDAIEFYTAHNDERMGLEAFSNGFQRILSNSLGTDTKFQEIKKGVESCLQLLFDLDHFISHCTKEASKKIKILEEIRKVLDIAEFSQIISRKTARPKKLSYAEISEHDRIFRFKLKNEVQKLLGYTYRLDAFISVAETSKWLNLTFADIDQGPSNVIDIKGLFHPLLSNAVPNDIKITEKENLVFLTGANMAGKSTFMKSFGISIYLAHIGFPVPARQMRLSIQNGMYTTINLKDNLEMGYSHFYAEVNRVKKIAKSVNSQKRLVVIFDELFRGTNVKDAHDATVAVSNAFANQRDCSFIISSHIIEAGLDLKKMRDNISFLYLPSIIKGNQLKYNYTLKEGITNDRHGMVIIENEGILKILKRN